MYGGFRECFAICGSYLIFYFAYHPQIKLWSFAKYGDLSYGVYVYAFPIQQLVVLNYGASITPVENFLYSYPFILILAFMSWHLVESPALKFKKRVSFKWADKLHKYLLNNYVSCFSVPSLSGVCISSFWWCGFFVVFSYFIFCTLNISSIPSFVEFPNVKNETILHGNWHVQSSTEKYRWIKESASIDLFLPSNAKNIVVEGYLPESFSEISKVQLFLNDKDVQSIDIVPGNVISLKSAIPKEAFSNKKGNIRILFNGVHYPNQDSPDKRELSALIKKIAFE